MQKNVAKAAGFLWEIIQSVTFALGIAVVLYAFFFVPTEVLGTSSFPNLKNQERLITEKFTYYFISPQRDDFVIAKSPQNPDTELVKRIIGLPGETIKISRGKVFINGVELDESKYLSSNIETPPGAFLEENQSYQIPKGQYFLMGDNRTNSLDSRWFGPVKRENIIGRVLLRYWPLNRFGVIPNN